MVRIARALLAAGLGVTLLVALPRSALATGPYTRPFFETGVSPSNPYGCADDFYPAFYGTNADDTSFNCAHFHFGIDYPIDQLPVVASRGGEVKEVVNNVTGHTCSTTGPLGNYVLIKHDSTHFTLYLHLQKDSMLVAKDDLVSAGQKIATSGNTGQSCGPHLHYTLTKSQDTPFSAAKSYTPDGTWTTGGSGRVPWKADFVSQTSGTSVIGSAEVCYGDTISYWVRYENTGGQTWHTSDDEYGRGRVSVWSTDDDGVGALASQFHAADWISSSEVTGADQSSVAPDATGTFTFDLHGSGTVGQTYTNYFNLDAHSLHWFDYDIAGHFRIAIFVLPHGACG